MPETINDLVADLVPHQGAMCLLEEIVRWDEAHAVLTTMTHRSPGNPLRNPAGRLRAVHLCEYGAQAMAVHGSLSARAAGQRAKPGLLVSLREVRFYSEFIEDLEGPLTVTATCLLASEQGWQYAFKVQAAQRLLAEGRAAIVMRLARGASTQDPS